MVSAECTPLVRTRSPSRDKPGASSCRKSQDMQRKELFLFLGRSALQQDISTTGAPGRTQLRMPVQRTDMYAHINLQLREQQQQRERKRKRREAIDLFQFKNVTPQIHAVK